jgi:N6-adenosine-specific RNA methylase IME4
MTHSTPAWFFDPLPMFGFDVCVVDPPTSFALYSEKGNRKSASAQYKTMPWEALAAMPVGNLVRANGIILLWACPPTLDKSMELLKVWGALYKTELVWPKGRMGTGYRSRGMHESVLLGVFGNEHQVHDAFYGVIKGKARGHSRKPDEFYDAIIQRTPGLDRCDIFARQSRDGFATWGDEQTKFDAGQPEPESLPAASPAPTPLFDILGAAA